VIITSRHRPSAPVTHRPGPALHSVYRGERGSTSPFVVIGICLVLLLGSRLPWPTNVIASRAASPDTWTSTGTMIEPRRQHTATLLQDGRVLVVGGRSSFDTPSTSTAELYDPATGTWQSTGSMAVARIRHTATLLPGGLVLVAGGVQPGVAASAELYNPATGTWSQTGSMLTSRFAHQATLLPNGSVLVTGGTSGNVALASAEVYDPASGAWRTTGAMASPRLVHSASLLADGSVLVAGGSADTLPAWETVTLASAEIYDLATGVWSPTGSMAHARRYHVAVPLGNGRIIAIGGYDGSATVPEEIYDPATRAWQSTDRLIPGRYTHAATLLQDGRVLAVGGYGGPGIGYLADARVYDAASATWSGAGAMATAREFHTVMRLADGRVLVAGGNFRDEVLASAEIYDPAGSGEPPCIPPACTNVFLPLISKAGG
jgi:hypothetical protein